MRTVSAASGASAPYGQRGLGGERAVLGQDARQRDAVHRLHHQRRALRGGHEPEQPDHVRVGDPAEHDRLVPQPGEPPLPLARITGRDVEVLDRHRRPGVPVPREDDASLRARAQLPDLLEPLDPPPAPGPAGRGLFVLAAVCGRSAGGGHFASAAARRRDRTSGFTMSLSLS
nr:hypothetical protein [Actinomadura logoneensis]